MEQLRKKETEQAHENTDGRKMKTEGYDTVEEGEKGELSSTLLSDIINIQPSVSFKMISPIKSPSKEPKQKTRKRRRSDHSFTVIVIQKHKHH